MLAAVFIAEIGDIARFGNADQLACWAGLTPRVHSSDNKTRHSSISKQGSRLVRWAAVEAVANQPKGSHFHTEYHRHLERRGRPGIAKVAIARKLMRLVFFAMRDPRNSLPHWRGCVEAAQPPSELARGHGLPFMGPVANF